ncbi:unnamed protein product [marine sediment metagenome]|uniref:N-acetyltransferase domain-containing protein n=1 Tax=marine sediment metagenome TaxID=412755 RepID=X0UMF9_9ZZZZ
MERNLQMETERLLLRSVAMSDVEEVARTYEIENGPLSIERATEAISWMANNHRLNSPRCFRHVCLAVFPKGRNEIIGWCGLDGGFGQNKDRTKIEI